MWMDEGRETRSREEWEMERLMKKAGGNGLIAGAG